MAPAGGRSARRSWTRRARRGPHRGHPFAAATTHTTLARSVSGGPRPQAPGPATSPRRALPALGARRAGGLGGRTVAGEEVLSVGDTPDHVACGRQVGARAVGVAAGFCDVAAVRGGGAAHVFPTLAETAAVLDAIFA